MKYKDYEATVKYDEESEIFYGEVTNMRDVITFQGNSVNALKKAFEDSIEDYMDFCHSRGEEPDAPFTGKFAVQVSPELHQRLYKKAKRSGKSLNSFIEESLASI